MLLIEFNSIRRAPARDYTVCMIKVIIQMLHKEVSDIEQYTIDCEFSPIWGHFFPSFLVQNKSKRILKLIEQKRLLS